MLYLLLSLSSKYVFAHTHSLWFQHCVRWWFWVGMGVPGRPRCVCHHNLRGGAFPNAQTAQCLPRWWWCNLEGSVQCFYIRNPVFKMHLLTFRIEMSGMGIWFVVWSASILSVVKLARFPAVVGSARPAALRHRGSVRGGTRAAPWGTTELFPQPSYCHGSEQLALPS